MSMMSAPMTERHQTMLDVYKGGKTLQEVGAMFGVTRERVRVILIRQPAYQAAKLANAANRRMPCKGCGTHLPPLAERQTHSLYCPECRAKPLTETCRCGCGKTPRSRSHYAAVECRLAFWNAHTKAHNNERYKTDKEYHESQKANQRKNYAKKKLGGEIVENT